MWAIVLADRAALVAFGDFVVAPAPLARANVDIDMTARPTATTRRGLMKGRRGDFSVDMCLAAPLLAPCGSAPPESAACASPTLPPG